MLSKVLALFQQARELRDRIQQSRPVEELRDLRSSDVIHSPSRQLGQELLLELMETGQRISGLKYQLMHLEEQAMSLEHRYQKALKMDPSASSTNMTPVKKEESDLLGYLTEEEKAKLLSVVEERKGQEAAQIEDPDAEFVTPQRGALP